MALTRRTIFSLGGPEILPDPRVQEQLAAQQLRLQGQAQANQQLQHAAERRDRLVQLGRALADQERARAHEVQLFERQAQLGAQDRAARLARDLQAAAMQNAAELERERLQQAGFADKREFERGQAELDRASREGIAELEAATRLATAGPRGPSEAQLLAERFKRAHREAEAEDKAQQNRGENLQALVLNNQPLQSLLLEAKGGGSSDEVLAKAGRIAPQAVEAAIATGDPELVRQVIAQLEPALNQLDRSRDAPEPGWLGRNVWPLLTAPFSGGPGVGSFEDATLGRLFFGEENVAKGNEMLALQNLAGTQPTNKMAATLAGLHRAQRALEAERLAKRLNVLSQSLDPDDAPEVDRLFNEFQRLRRSLASNPYAQPRGYSFPTQPQTDPEVDRVFNEIQRRRQSLARSLAPYAPPQTDPGRDGIGGTSR